MIDKSILILTDNKYLKLGFESFIHQEIIEIPEVVIMYDRGEFILFFWRLSKSDGFFKILSRGVCFNKKMIYTTRHFFRNLGMNRKKNLDSSNKKPSGELSKCEQSVIKSLCEGRSTLEISKKSNITIKTVSSHKISALKKLRVRNIQKLHREMIRWDSLTKEITSSTSHSHAIESTLTKVI